MTPTLVVLVSGPPAAGKTTISRRLAKEFRLTLVAKDVIKETLFDTLGVRDPAWTRELGRASIFLLWQFVEASLQAGQSVIAESNFHSASDSERLARLRGERGFRVYQIHCTAPSPVLWARAVAREHSGARHHGHRGILVPQGDEVARHSEEFETALAQGVWGALRIVGETLTVDTTDWADIPWDAV